MVLSLQRIGKDSVCFKVYREEKEREAKEIVAGGSKTSGRAEGGRLDGNKPIDIGKEYEENGKQYNNTSQFRVGK